MIEEDERFKGLTITLKKRKLCVSGENGSGPLDSGEYLVLGHFDHMTIKRTDKWLDWAPYHTENVSLKDEYIDKYNIKGYFPKRSQRARYQENGFDFDTWLKEDTEYPFVIVSVINISDEYAKRIKGGNQIFCDAIFELILDCIRESSSEQNWKEMHGAFFPTIGYSDLVLLFKTIDPEPILNLLEYMKQRKELVKDTGKSFPNLSSAYTFLSFCDRGIDKIKDHVEKNVELAIRFGMQDGISTKDFQHYLDDVLGEEKQIYYRALGDSDLMLIPQLKLKEVLPEYFFRSGEVPGVFNPSHKSFSYIRSMQTEFCMQLPTEEYEVKALPETAARNIESYRQKYLGLLNKLDEFLSDNQMPQRIVYGLQIVMKRYLQLIQSRHCFDMETIIGHAFSNFVKCIEKDIEIVESLEVEKRYEEIRQMLVATNTFREKIGEYLADMQRSDSLFLEGRSLSHPSIGSATKLLFFYNGYIDNTKDLICKEREKNQYSFVVISGGTDQTQAIDLFSHLDPARGDIPSVILITVPEASLYDVKSSLFNVLHEMLHFCGDRQRKCRWDFIVEAVSGYTASAFGDLLENAQMSATKDIIENLCIDIRNDKNVFVKIKESFDKETGDLKRELKRILKQAIVAKATKMTKEQYYSRKVYNYLYKLIKELFYSENEDESLTYKIYELYQNYQIAVLKKLDKVVKECNIPYSNFTFIAATYSKRNTDKFPYNKYDMGLIEYIVSKYFGQYTRLEKKYGKIIEKDAHIELKALLIIVENLFKECYADCMAGDIMKIELPQFIMSFLSEARNEREAFSNDILTRLRIMTDFQYLFKIENGLSEESKCVITEYAKKEKEKGANHIYAEKVVNHLDELISKKESEEERISELTNPVQEYLKSCKETWSEQGIKLQDIQKLNVCTELDTPNETYDFLDYVTYNWMCYAR